MSSKEDQYAEEDTGSSNQNWLTAYGAPGPPEYTLRKLVLGDSDTTDGAPVEDTTEAPSNGLFFGILQLRLNLTRYAHQLGLAL